MFFFPPHFTLFCFEFCLSFFFLQHSSRSFFEPSLSILSELLPFPHFVITYRSGGQHWRVVIYVCDSDDGSGCVGQAKVKVSLHVRGLHNDGVL